MKDESEQARKLAEKSQNSNSRRNSRIRKVLTYIFVLFLIFNAFGIMSSSLIAAESGDPKIWTDKEDYPPDSTVYILGENFTANDPIEVKITRPDGSVEYANNTVDENGELNTTYLLNGIYGEYLVEATDEHGLYAWCTFTDSKPPELFGWDWKFDDWTKSTLEGYGAGEWVWWHIVIYNTEPGDYKIQGYLDNYHKIKDAYGFVELDDFRLLETDYPTEVDTGITVDWEVYYPEDSNTIFLGFNATFTVPESRAGEKLFLRWDARMDEGETIDWPGKALHAHFNTWWLDGEEQSGGGNQDVQVEQPVSPPLSRITGYKYHDEDGDGQWDEGEPPLEGWEFHLGGIDIYGKVVDRYWTTDENGFYQFVGIIRGDYWINETLQEGWGCTNRSGDPPSTGLIEIDTKGTYLDHVDFGNAPLTPEISVTKTGDVTLAHVGDTVTYTVTVTNTGDSTLHDVYVTDDVTGQTYYKVDDTGSDTLTPAATWTFSYTYTILETDPDPLVNTATAYGTDPFGTVVTDEDTHTVEILNPDIEVIKSASPTVIHNGDSVTYTYTVENTGDCTLTVSVSDDQLGDLTADFEAANSGSDVLDAGDSVTFTVTTDIYVDTVNIVTATGTDELGLDVTDTASASVDVLNPDIEVTKSASPTVIHSGDSVTYTYTVENTGDCTLTVTVSDDKLGDLTNNFEIANGGSDVLGAGDSVTFTVTTTITEDTTNVVTATGTDELGLDVTDTASASVDVLNPDIEVTKSVSPTVIHNGDSVTYTYTVENTGDCTLTVSVSDDKLGDITSYFETANGGSDILDAGDSVTFTVTTNIYVDTVNVVTATGTDELGLDVTDTATASVDVLNPDIEVTKSASPTVIHNGDSVTYTYTVENTGDCTLTVSVSDDKLGDLTADFEAANGGSDVLDAGDSVTFTVTTTITEDTTNIVTATGTDELGLDVTDTATATVDVLNPDIEVTKSASPTVIHSGDSVTYTYTVENTGDCTLTVSVSDDKLGDITIYFETANGGSDVLDAGDSVTFTVTTTITEDTTNVVTATGTDDLGLDVTDTATASVDVLNPDIEVTKSASPTVIHNGDSVTYTYTVENTGDCTLTVSVSDDQLGDLTADFVAANGGSDVLDAGDSVTFTVTTTITEDTTNVVTATGTDELGLDVTDTDTASVDVLNPAIDVTKSVSPTVIYSGDSVTYTYTVENTGDCSLTVAIWDDQLGDLTADFIAANGGSDVLDAGDSVTFTVTTTLTEDTTNVVTATGTDELGLDVTDTDTASVDVLNPDIEVTKSVSPTMIHSGDSVTYTYVVENTGDTSLTVSVWDDQLGDLTTDFVEANGGSDVLDPGDSVTFTVTTTITEDTTNVVTVTGTDELGTDVTDTDTASVDVLNPAIDVTKSVSPTVIHNGDSVTYTYTVENTGDASLTVSVWDDQLGDLTADFVAANGGSDILGVGASVTFTVTTNIYVDTVNIVTATGTDELGLEVTDTDTASVDVLNPAIEVTKLGPVVAHEGDIISYLFTVKNTGDCILYDVTVSDDVLGDLTGYLPDDTLTVGETNTFTVSYTVPTPSDDFTNTVTASGTDILDETVTDTDSHTVDVLHPAIEVTKESDADVYRIGDTVEYTIVVTNIGDCTLYSVILTDSDIGWTSSPIQLDVGSSQTYTVYYTITGSEPDPFTNIVLATGKDIIGDVKGTVEDDDDNTIDIIHPAIEVIKTSDTTYVYQGDTVTINYFFTVSNTGDCTLYNVLVIDDVLGDLTSNLPDDTLDIGEVNTFTVTVTHTVPEDACDFTNVVTATGEDGYGGEVSDTDSWTIIALPRSQVTDTSFCIFDKDPETDGQQFRLLFTQNPHNPGTYKLTSSNPGQFYYNVFYLGTEGDTVTLDITIPYPFVTQGAVPIHFYGGASYGRCGCFRHSDELSGFTVTGTDTLTPSGALGIELSDHVNGFVTITVTGTVPASGLVYVTIHLDYGLKKEVDYQKSGSDGAIHPDPVKTIPNYNDYMFSVAGDLVDSQVVQNMNVFKRNPGFGGIVVDSSGNPIPYVVVQIYGPDGKLIGTTVTDGDGYWFFYWKHKGKEANYTIKIPMFGKEKTVTLKANKFAEVNFVI
jgi:uncharacterized repeat protein (TIGR01451 family)